VLSEAEARALLALAEEGALLLEDPEAAKAYIGPASTQRAARRAVAKLRSTVYSPREPLEGAPPGVTLN
jgi:hypothetical protein